LDGVFRPGHFDGVATVVARLFGVVRPQVAIFGEKDWQQLAVIRRMTADLALPVQIVSGTLVRDDDGVALSSRNSYLAPDQRNRARSLSRALFAMVGAARAGHYDTAALLELGRSKLDVDRLDYLSVADPETLQPVKWLEKPARVLVAAHVGR